MARQIIIEITDEMERALDITNDKFEEKLQRWAAQEIGRTMNFARKKLLAQSDKTLDELEIILGIRE